jgi:hypothetical protein
LFTLCSAASLLLCVAACGGWIGARLCVAGSVGRIGAVGDGVGLWLNRNDVALVRETHIAIPAGGTLLPPAKQAAPGLVRVSLARSGPFRPLPYWALAACAAALPAAWIWRTRKSAARSRLSRGLCPTCGYDLRASPERCPECGTAT